MSTETSQPNGLDPATATLEDCNKAIEILRQKDAPEAASITLETLQTKGGPLIQFHLKKGGCADAERLLIEICDRIDPNKTTTPKQKSLWEKIYPMYSEDYIKQGLLDVTPETLLPALMRMRRQLIILTIIP